MGISAVKPRRAPVIEAGRVAAPKNRAQTREDGRRFAAIVLIY